LKFIVKKISAGNDEFWEIWKNDEGYEDLLILANREHMVSLVNVLIKDSGLLSGYSERCNSRFAIRNVVFKCDLQGGHSGSCISMPDGPGKVATIMWPKESGF
jgi:hypothetical protein